MTIHLQSASKRFNYEWIFRNINYTFYSGKKIAITGANGSGKSTLMRMLSGQLSPSEGSITYMHGDKNIPVDSVYQHIAFTAPYIDLIEELSFSEIVQFQLQFKPLLQNVTPENCIELSGLYPHRNKLIKNYSSGMKQRVKLCLTILADSPLLLLDEPTTNLDAAGVAWYQDMIMRFAETRTIIVSSNIEREYSFCDEILVIENYKS